MTKYENCPECKASTIHLATVTVCDFWGDQDDGEGNESEYDDVKITTDEISLFAHICFECGHLQDVGIEYPRNKALNTREEPPNNGINAELTTSTNVKEDTLQALMDKWSEIPDLRLGQLLMNVVSPKEPCAGLFYIEDSKLIDLLNEFKIKK